MELAVERPMFNSISLQAYMHSQYLVGCARYTRQKIILFKPKKMAHLKMPKLLNYCTI